MDTHWYGSIVTPRIGRRRRATPLLAALAPCVLVVLSAWLAPGAALAELPQQRGGVDLLNEANVRLEGAAAGYHTGMDVASTGDVNGDRIDDLIVGAPDATENGRQFAGSAYVVFGGRELRRVDLGSLGPDGIRIDGAEPGDHAGTAVDGAGDVNGDRLADVIVGAPQAAPPGKCCTGISYVVFGRRDAGIVDLADYEQTRAAFALVGAGTTDESGQAVAGAGDVDNDRLDDLIVGAPKAAGERPGAGTAYVVFGRAAMGTASKVDLGAIGPTQLGFEIQGARPDDAAGYSVASAGDLNGDRYDDVVVGAPHASNNSRSFSGSAYVVFGAPRSDTVDLSDPFGNRWYRIDGEETGDKAGTDVAGGEDANGDGNVDVVVGAPYADRNGRQISGSAYVLFCGVKPGEARDLRELGEHGYRIDGGMPGDRAGFAVDLGGDVNGDELADVILGAPTASYRDRPAAGAAYAVYGKRSYGRPSIEPIDLGKLGGGGFRMDGAAAEDRAGFGAAWVGDFNGDERADVGVGAPLADDNGTSGGDAGNAYVVYGFAQPELANEGDEPHGLEAQGRGCPPGDAAGAFNSRLWVPREVPLADLAGRHGVGFDVGASGSVRGEARLTIAGAGARRLGLLASGNSGRAKLLGRTPVELQPRVRSYYRLRTSPSARRLLRRVLRKRSLPATVRLKLVVELQSTADASVQSVNALSMRGRIKGNLRRGGNRNRAAARAESTCGLRQAAAIGTPREVPYTLLVRRGGKPGPGIPVRVSCESACNAEVEVRIWGRFGEALGLWRRRRASRHDENVVARRTVALEAGQAQEIRLTVDDASLRKRIAKPLVNLRKAPRRVKAKVVLVAKTPEGRALRDERTLRLRLRR